MVYLIVLGFADLTVMVSFGVSDIVSYYHAAPHPVYCGLIQNIYAWSQLISVYTIVALSADRLYITTYPLEAPQNMSPRKVLVIVACYSAACLLPRIPYLFTRPRVTDGTCVYATDSFIYGEAFLITELIVQYVAPFVTIVILNILIVRALKKARQAREEMSLVVKEDKVTKQVTRTLTGTTVWFLITILMHMVYTIYFFAEQVGDILPTFQSLKKFKNIIIIFVMSSVLLHLNYACNLFTYCLTGSIFRGEFKKVFDWCCCCKAENANSTKPARPAGKKRS